MLYHNVTSTRYLITFLVPQISPTFRAISVFKSHFPAVGLAFRLSVVVVTKLHLLLYRSIHINRHIQSIPVLLLRIKSKVANMKLYCQIFKPFNDGKGVET